MACVKGLVSGRVQGVGFRYFVRRQAEAAGLQGYVRNLDDGGVEFVLQGDSSEIDSVLAKIRVGPQYASVSDLRYESLSSEANYPAFEIR